MQFIDLKAQQKIIKDKINARIKDVLRHGKYIMGPEVYELEKSLAKFSDMKYCISCASGTDALLMSLMAKGIGPGDAIITTPFTYIATAEVIKMLGATPVFCDIYKSTFNLNPEKLEECYDNAISRGLKPKGVIPVNLFGLPARYRLIKEFTDQKKIFVLEDAAQSFGGRIKDRMSCSFGDISATSFFPAKPLGAYGDGGAIFTNNLKLANKLKSIRVHGSGESKYNNIRLGLNGRLDTIQAAILIEKLKIFQNELYLRNKIAKRYNESLKRNFSTPFVPKNYYSSWAQYSIVAKSKNNRKDITLCLKSKNIPSMIYYSIPLHLQKVFSDLKYSKNDFPVSEFVSERIFSIPMYPYLPKENQIKIIETLNKHA